MVALFRKLPLRIQSAPLASGGPMLDETWLRPRGDAYVRIDAHDYALRAWSPAGFHLAPYDGPLVARQTARVTMVVRDFHEKDGGLTLCDEVTVLRVDAHGLLAKWRPLSPQKKAQLVAYYVRKAGRH